MHILDRVSEMSVSEDVQLGIQIPLVAGTLVAYNFGLDDYVICTIGQELRIPTPVDVNASNFVETSHFVLVATDADLNGITTPEIAYPFFIIVPYNDSNLHFILPDPNE